MKMKNLKRRRFMLLIGRALDIFGLTKSSVYPQGRPLWHEEKVAKKEGLVGTGKTRCYRPIKQLNIIFNDCRDQAKKIDNHLAHNSRSISKAVYTLILHYVPLCSLQVVIALADQTRDHVPFRSSKLTHFLKVFQGPLFLGNLRLPTSPRGLNVHRDTLEETSSKFVYRRTKISLNPFQDQSSFAHRRCGCDCPPQRSTCLREAFVEISDTINDHRRGTLG